MIIAFRLNYINYLHAPPMHCTLLPMIPINLILYSFSTVTPGPTQDSFGSHEPLESGGHDVESIITIE